MQKKIIALAVAGLMSGAAFAQSNVTVYGVVDHGQAWVKTSGNTANAADVDQKNVGRLDANSSYIGFKGTEDLGGGMKALFQIENGLTSDATGGTWANRDTFVGLTGNFGTVVAGTLTHPLRAMGAKAEILPGAGAGFGSAGSITGELYGIKTGADERASNAVAYVSPNFSGFTVTGAYVNGEATESGSNNAGVGYNAKAWQLAGQYENGPMYVGAAYHKATDVTLATTMGAGGGNAGIAFAAALNGADARVWRLAATYDLPFGTKIMGLYDNTHVITPGVATNYKRSAWSLGAKQSFGVHTIGAQYARSSDVNVTGADADDSAKIFTLGYEYALSKRTQIHARWSKLSNDKAGMNTFYSNPVRNPHDGGAGSDSTGYMLGLRHSF